MTGPLLVKQANQHSDQTVLEIVLYQPEIPPNTGNIIRLCANTGAPLHLIAPLGFKLEDRQLRRAGLDYHEWARIEVHDNLDDLLAKRQDSRVFPISTRGCRAYHDLAYRDGDLLLFGPETRGLPQEILEQFPEAHRLYIPMCPNNRSLNLSNATAVILYEAWRQLAFVGATR